MVGECFGRIPTEMPCLKHLNLEQCNMVCMLFSYTITNWRVLLSKLCHEWPNNTVTHEMRAAHEWVTTLFGHEWHIFDIETRQLVIVFII